MIFFSREYRIPLVFKEVLGEHQSAGALLCIALVTALAALSWMFDPGLATREVSVWRGVLAWLLMLDIAAGAVANFTRGTNDFYATRPTWRWGFIAVHMHLPVVGALLNIPLAPLLVMWVFTMGAAALVNLCYGRVWQPVVASALLCVGMLVAAYCSISGWQLSLSLLFLLKVVYAFGVNHYPSVGGSLGRSPFLDHRRG